MPDEVRSRIIELWKASVTQEDIVRRLSEKQVPPPVGQPEWRRKEVAAILAAAGLGGRSFAPVPPEAFERIVALAQEGLWPDEIAARLTREGVPTLHSSTFQRRSGRPTQGTWGAVPVLNVLRRAGFRLRWMPPTGS